VLLLSRFVEGVGLGLLTVPAIMLIGFWFPPEKRGLASGIFSMWLPLGSTAMLNAAPFVHDRFGGWRAVWWLGALVMLVSIPLTWWTVREAAPMTARSTSPATSRWQTLRLALRSPAVLLAAAFALFHASRQALITWAPAFLVSRGLTLGDAAALASVATLTTIPLCLVAGGAIAFFKSARLVYVLGLLVGAPLMALIFLVPISGVAPLLVLSGIAASLVPTAVNAAAPDARPRGGSPGLAVATVAVGRNGGMLLGPFAIGVLLQVSNLQWPLVAWTLAGASLVGALFAWLVPPTPRP
jgi:MFS family permease